MAKMGRPTKLTPELADQIVQNLRAGAYIETAAKAAGINKTTLHDWLNRGQREDSGTFRDFHAACMVAMADDEMRDVRRVQQLGEAKVTVPCPACSEAVEVPVPDKVALAAVTWKMERKAPDRYGGKIKIEHRTQDRIHEIVDAVEPHMPPESYAHFLRALAAIMGEEGLAAAEAPEGGGEPTPVH